MNIGDAGALGTLFSHLHSDSQIDTFLTAFETLRRDRVKKVLPIELMNTYHIVMPDEELRQQRNAAFRERRDAGLDAFSGEKDDFAVALWEVGLEFSDKVIQLELTRVIIRTIRRYSPMTPKTPQKSGGMTGASSTSAQIMLFTFCQIRYLWYTLTRNSNNHAGIELMVAV